MPISIKILLAGLLLVTSACGQLIPDKDKTMASPALEQEDVAGLPERKIDSVILVEGLNHPWSMAFVPGDEGILITEKYGSVRRYANGRLFDVEDAPKPLAYGEAGLLDIALDPDFAKTRRVYLSFVEGVKNANRVVLFSAKYDGKSLQNGKVIYRSPTTKVGQGHSGSRIMFMPDKSILVSIGDGFQKPAEAQNIHSSLGKIFWLNRDGNPAQRSKPVIANGLPGLFSMGHRNIEGLAIDSETGFIWATEHGPKGGDELNRIVSGANYGWPKTTYGVDSDGRQITSYQTAPGIVEPSIVWVPSIAPSGLAIYRGNKFPEWQGDLLVGALAGRHLRRIRMSGTREVLQQVLLRELESRIRDVRVSPDGDVYILTDGENGKLHKLVYSPPS